MGHSQLTSDPVLHPRLRNAAAALALALCMLPLGGCGGVQFQGKIFDYMGLTGDKQASADPNMPARPGLVIPPNTHYLPPPGSQPNAPTVADWPQNPETVRKQLLAQKQAAQEKKAAELDPQNPYAGKPTLLDKLLHRNRQGDTSDEVASVPAPDPSDSIPPVNQTKTATAQKPYRPPGITTPEEEDDPYHPKVPNTYKAVTNGTYRGM